MVKENKINLSIRYKDFPEPLKRTTDALIEVGHCYPMLGTDSPYGSQGQKIYGQ